MRETMKHEINYRNYLTDQTFPSLSGTTTLFTTLSLVDIPISDDPKELIDRQEEDVSR